jgi:ribosome-associated toxin RatA of RatAB toxin-antitoxin module
MTDRGGSRTRSSIDIAAPPATVMTVISDFAAYPRWATEISRVSVLTTDESTGRPRTVRFHLETSALRDEHTLAYTFEDDRAVHWTLVDSQMLRALDGSYLLEPAGDGTHVTYELTVDVKIPMIGLLKRRAEKAIIERALSGLKRRVEAIGDAVSDDEAR